MQEQVVKMTGSNSVSDSKLLRASCEGDVVEVQRLLLQVWNPADVKTFDRKTLLHYSCHHGWLGLTRKFVEQYHCDLESRDVMGNTPLHEACYWGHVNIVRYLVGEQGCSTACQNKDGDTPLHEACKKGHLAVVEILLKSKDCSIACNKHSNVLIVNSCRHGWLDVTRKLVEQYH